MRGRGMLFYYLRRARWGRYAYSEQGLFFCTVVQKQAFYRIRVPSKIDISISPIFQMWLSKRTFFWRTIVRLAPLHVSPWEML